MLILGSLYILAVFLVYFLEGLGLLTFFSSLPLIITEYISISVSLIVIGAGIIEIKDFFWYSKGISLTIPYKVSKMIPFGQGLDEALTNVTELRQLYDQNPNVKKMVDAAKHLEGVARHASVHACGISTTGASLPRGRWTCSAIPACNRM